MTQCEVKGDFQCSNERNIQSALMIVFSLNIFLLKSLGRVIFVVYLQKK